MMPVSMVGRAAELDELVARAWSDRGASGSPGPARWSSPGTPAWARACWSPTALAGLTPRPSAVLSGTARVHAPAPYDWLAAVLSGRDTDATLPVPAGRAGLAGPAPGRPGASGTRPGRCCGWRYAPCGRWSATGRRVLVVEDLHALDPASLNLVAELAAAPELPAAAASSPAGRRTPRSRPGWPRGPWPGWPARPARSASTSARSASPTWRRSSPRPSRTACLARAGGAPCSERTGGNPYWLRELLATAGAAGPDELAAGPLPEPRTPADAHSPARPDGRADRPGDRRADLPGRRDVEQAGRPLAGHLPADRHGARVEPAAQDPVGLADGGGAVGRAASDGQPAVTVRDSKLQGSLSVAR